jgi:hypothetical protein
MLLFKAYVDIARKKVKEVKIDAKNSYGTNGTRNFYIFWFHEIDCGFWANFSKYFVF